MTLCWVCFSDTCISVVTPARPAQVDRHVHFFASSFNLYNEDLDALMGSSRQLQEGGLDVAAAARRSACEWVQAQQDRWRAWIPAVCPPGRMVDATFLLCSPCPAGSFCEGDAAPAVVCPVGFYCPDNSSAPTPCPSGRVTVGTGAGSALECGLCASGYVLLAGSCVPYVAVFPSVILPAVCLATLAILLACRRRGGEDEAPVAQAVAEVRRRLALTPAEGFLLDTERPPWRWPPWRSAARGSQAVRFVRIQREHMEAAGRLLLQRDFDPKLLNFFCMCLYGRSPQDERLRTFLLDESQVRLAQSPGPQRLLECTPVLTGLE